MPAERFYIPSDLSVGTVVTIEGTEFHHLTNVMRVKEGEQIELVNGTGQLANGVLTKLNKKNASVTISEMHTAERPTFEVVLAQAIPRLNRLDTIIEKATELGATEITLFPTQGSERKTLSDQQLERVRTITIASMKQCGRLFLPRITILPSLEKWSQPIYKAFFGDLNPSAKKFANVCQWHDIKKGILFFVGPESGFTEQERQLLLSLGAEGVQLSDATLRTDTAAITALSLINHSLLKTQQ